MTKVFEAIDCPIWYVWGADYLYRTIPNFRDGSITVWSKRMSETENSVFGSAFELLWTYPRKRYLVHPRDKSIIGKSRRTPYTETY